MIRRSLLKGIFGLLGLTALPVESPSAKPPVLQPKPRNAVLRGQRYAVASGTVINKGDMLWMCQDGTVTNRSDYTGPNKWRV